MKTILTLLLITVYTVSFCQIPTTEEVSNMAYSFLNEKKARESLKLKSAHIQQIKEIKTVSVEGQVLFHVVELEPKGFVILSNNKSIDPVIAYSDQSDFNYSSDSTNILYNLLSNDLLNRQLKVKGETNIWENEKFELKSANVSEFQQWPEEGTTSTGGWIETTWHQHDPYNNFCPIDSESGNRSVVGCVATAVSQLVNYHKYIGDFKLTEKDKYTSSSILIDSDSSKFDFPSFTRLNNYTESIKDKFNNKIELNEEEIAALNFICGIVSKMNYSSSGSGAVLSEELFTDNFGYLESKSIEDYYSCSSTVKENIRNGLPVLFSITNEDALFHTIVADGYNTDEFFHLNFGWGGNLNDVWYKIPNEMGAGYNEISKVIFDIIPTILEKSKLIVSDPTVNLGRSIPNISSPAKMITITNESDFKILIYGINVDSPFKIGTTETNLVHSIDSITLNENSSMNLYVQFCPDTIGIFNGEISILSNAPNNLDIKVTGYGLPEGGTMIAPGNTSGIWNKENSPYYIMGDIIIEDSEKLKINSGVKVYFTGPYGISKKPGGQLIAKGSLNDSIDFCGYSTSIKWKGLAFEGSLTDTLSYCLVHGCDDSGILANISARVFIEYSRICNNSSFIHGGGLNIMNSSEALVRNSIIHDNYSSFSGAGIFCADGSKLTLLNTVIARNGSKYKSESCSSGGGIYSLQGSKVNIINSIIYDNVAVLGKAFSVYNGTINVNYCCIDSSENYLDYRGGENDIINFGEGNLFVDPLFEDDLKSTNTTASLGFLLSSASPCIDAGNPDSKFNDKEDSDKEEFALWPALGSLRNDMGAFGGSNYSLHKDTLVENITICFNEKYVGWSTTGTYYRNLISSQGLDSLVITNLNVLPQPFTYEEVFICKGESYEAWTESGIYQRRNLVSVSGCDSTVTTKLTVIDLQNPNFTYNLDTLTSVDSYDSYQWYNQDGAIIGETSNQYVIEKSGTYFLEVTNEYGCKAISDGIEMIKTGVNNYENDHFKLLVLPNPNNGKFRLRFENKNTGKYQVQIINKNGQLILNKEIYSVQNIHEEVFNLSSLPKGNYFIRVFDGEKTNTKKLILK